MLPIFITIRLNYYVSTFKKMGVDANGPHPFYDIASTVPWLASFEITPANCIVAALRISFRIPSKASQFIESILNFHVAPIFRLLLQPPFLEHWMPSKNASLRTYLQTQLLIQTQIQKRWAVNATVRFQHELPFKSQHLLSTQREGPAGERDLSPKYTQAFVS